MTDTDDKLSKATLLGMVAMGAATLVIANDFTALSVALPAIEKDLNTDLTTVQWIINGYAMVFGVCIVTGGRLADMFGRRRMLLVGAAIFSFFSVLGGFAPNVWLLLLARGAMGIGGALMWPSILGLTYALLPASKVGLAGGLILGAAGLGNAVGPLLGGFLTDAASWRWIFFLNLPVTVAAVAITLGVVERDKGKTKNEGIDYRGMAALSIGLLLLLLALDEGTDLGWTNPLILAFFAGSALALVGFGWMERITNDNIALVPDDVMKNMSFATACLATLLMSAIFFAALLYLPQFMTKELKYSASQSGAGLLPMMGVFAITSFIAGNIYARLGAKTVVSLGAACLAVGMFLLSMIDASTTYRDLVPGMVILGMGVGLFYSSITTAAITAIDPSRSSLGGAIVYMCQIAGGSIGLGLNTAIVVSASSLPVGIHWAFMVDGVLAVCGLVVALLFVGGKMDLHDIHRLQHRHRAHG